MTDFSESSVLLGANWPTVLDIEQARDHMDEELTTLLLSMEDVLTAQSWWDKAWIFRRYKKQIFIRNTRWQDKSGLWALSMGVYNFNADSVFGPKSLPVFYFRSRDGYDVLGDVLREKLCTEGHEVLDNHRHLVHRAVLQCPHERTAVKSYPVQVREQLVALFTEYVDFAIRHEDIIQAHVKQKS
jgi:enamine deaminase RidA (YjgF/YER057c/UK114 family)